MKVSKLIALLQDMPQDARVVVDGYEGGADYLEEVRQVGLALNTGGAYEGQHDVRDFDCGNENVVYLPRP
jgi:hypothetical protein